MNLTVLQMVGALSAVAAILFGALVLFSDRFLGFMRRTTWRRLEAHSWWFSNNQESRMFDRYGTGLGFFLGGIVFLAIILLKFVK
jgi:hypothetical protein